MAKTKNAQHQHEWYLRNKLKQQEKVKNNRSRIRKYIHSIKEKSCCCLCFLDGSVENNAFALQFHHIDPAEKEMSIGDAHKKGWSIKKIDKEISKCEIICANCHIKLHSFLE